MNSHTGVVRPLTIIYLLTDSDRTELTLVRIIIIKNRRHTGLFIGLCLQFVLNPGRNSVLRPDVTGVAACFDNANEPSETEAF